MRGIELFDTLYRYGLYALLYILMQAGRKGIGFFAEPDHLALTVALIVQTVLLCRFLQTPFARFFGALIAPAVYTAIGIPENPRWFLDMSHTFFWLSALPLAALGAWGRQKIWALSATSLINVFIFIFIFFFFEIKANAPYYQAFTSLPVSSQDVHVLFFFQALGLFTEEPHHRYIIVGGLLLGLFITLAQARALKNARELERLNRELEIRVETGVAKQLEQERLLVQQTRMAALGEMMGMIAHQWKQPLTIIGLLSHTVQTQLSKPRHNKEQIEEDLRTIDDQVAFMNQTAQDFRDFLKPSKEKQPFEITAAVLSTLNLTGRLIEHGGVHMNIIKTQEPLWVLGYPNEFKQVMMNLLGNAREAVLARHENPKKGKISLSIKREGANAVITVEDNGAGIDPGSQEKIFDNFFSTKAKGTGLGLYMAKTIIQAHMHGRIEAAECQEGARFVITLPLFIPVAA